MLKYQFPAVKGCQAGKDYYICMVPLGLMSKIFATDSSDVPAEYRAQRKLNEARIPEICGYILSNRDSYVFSALAASVDGDMKFVPADSNENAGILEIDMTASFLINDGQHRKKKRFRLSSIKTRDFNGASRCLLTSTSMLLPHRNP